jgi:hypothetical protein
MAIDALSLLVLILVAAFALYLTRKFFVLDSKAIVLTILVAVAWYLVRAHLMH